MPVAVYAAFVFTVALLVTTAYFLMGGLPLLILKHDVPLDARFILAFFELYYRVAFWTATGACLSFLLWGRWPFALGAGLIAALTRVLRHRLLRAMAQLGEKIAAAEAEAEAIGHFRRVHGGALVVNLLQLVVLVWGLLQLSRQLS